MVVVVDGWHSRLAGGAARIQISRYIQQPRLFSSVSLPRFQHTLLIHMASVELDAKRFHRRARFLISQWKVSPCSWYSSLGFLLESFFSPLDDDLARILLNPSQHSHDPLTTSFSCAWQSPSNANLFQQTDAILLLIGDDDYDNPYRKSVTAEVSERRASMTLVLSSSRGSWLRMDLFTSVCICV